MASFVLEFRELSCTQGCVSSALAQQFIIHSVSETGAGCLAEFNQGVVSMARELLPKSATIMKRMVAAELVQSQLTLRRVKFNPTSPLHLTLHWGEEEPTRTGRNWREVSTEWPQGISLKKPQSLFLFIGCTMQHVDLVPQPGVWTHPCSGRTES